MNRWLCSITTAVVMSGLSGWFGSSGSSGWMSLSAAPSDDLSAALASLPGYRSQELERRDIDQERSTGWEGVPAEVVAEYVALKSSRWRLRPDRGTALQLDTLQMLDAPGAYGLLSFWVLQQSEPPRRLTSLSRRAFRTPDRVIWTVGRHLFALSADEATASGLIDGLGQALQDPDISPVTAQYLPKPGRLAERTSFYLGPQGAGRDPDLPDWMIPLIGFRSGVELSVARYRSHPPFFLLGYPTPDLARAALQRLEGDPAAQQMSFKRSVVLIGAASQSNPELESLTYFAQIDWIQEKLPFDPRIPPSDMFEILRNWVIFTGFFVFVVLGTGGLIASVRYGLQRRFPAWAARDAMIQLGIDDR